MVIVTCGSSGLLTMALYTTTICLDHDGNSDVW